LGKIQKSIWKVKILFEIVKLKFSTALYNKNHKEREDLGDSKTSGKALI
jgi:hypothetical protein